MLGQTNTRLVSGVFRSISSSAWKCASHYDVLGITPKATQREIKSAYYKLSKIYHPDKNDDEASAKTFRAITEAYEVLGNINLKKMYDKGLMVGRQNTTRMDYRTEPEPTDPTVKFYKSRITRHVAPTMDGKTPIYDFDTWSKEHYGDLFKKTQYDKEMSRIKREKAEAVNRATNQEALMYLMFALCGLFVMLVVNGTTDYDRDVISQKSNAEKVKARGAED